MKKITILAALVAVFCGTGCRTITVENDGEGKGWKVSVMSNMMKSEVDNVKASISPDGTVSFDMGGLATSPSEESAKSLMTFTYIARIAAAMYSPAAATVPLSDAAADPQAVATAIKAQAEARAIKIKAQAEADAIKAQPQQSACTSGTCTGDTVTVSTK